MFKTRFSTILSLLCLVVPSVLSARTIINVVDQPSFDKVQANLVTAIKSGDKDINVIISKGTYMAKERHLTLNGIKSPDVRISIMGNDAIIISDGKEYKNGDKYQSELSVRRSWMNNSQDIKIWSDVRYADGLIEILDESKQKCRLKSKDPLASVANGASHILIPHWFQSSVYTIDKISGNYIYFTASDLKKSFGGGYNVNGDYHYGKKPIRFRLFNAKGSGDCVRILDGRVQLPSGISSARECIIHRYITIQNSSFRSVEIKGLKLWGNNYAYNDPAIYINNVNCTSLSVTGCEFRGMRGDVITIASSPNVLIENNTFYDCYNNGIQSDNKSKNTTVKDNAFKDMGKRMQNTFCILCRGENYLISGNKIEDFGYGGIGIGVHYKSEKPNPSKGIVENNEMTYTDSYIANIANYSIMDSGAIYVWTKNDGSIIRNNFIHGYNGMGDNRGIFCDDGAFNIQIYQNIITDIANSYCIDSRRAASVERSQTPESGIDRVNVNIVIRENIIDGRIRFVANEVKNNGCVKGANYILMMKDNRLPQNTIKSVDNAEEDIVLESNGVNKGKIYLSSKSFKQLRKTRLWNSARKYVTK